MYRMQLTDVRSGETRVVDFQWNYDSAAWEEGNYSCDCNRLRFLYPELSITDVECGEGLVTAELILLSEAE
jgi:hypothetical protein